MRAATREFQQTYILQALHEYGTVREAAVALGLHPQNLYRRMHNLGIKKRHTARSQHREDTHEQRRVKV